MDVCYFMYLCVLHQLQSYFHELIGVRPTSIGDDDNKLSCVI